MLGDGWQVEGLVRLMEGEHVGPFNLGNPGEFTMLELAEVSHLPLKFCAVGCILQTLSSFCVS
jgi:hypothetical protein